MKSEPIEKICKRYKGEWLLIVVDKMDEVGPLPLEGHVVAHSSKRDEIYKKQLRDPRELYVCYSLDPLAKRKAYAL